MKRFTTNEAAKQLGTTGTSLVRYIKAGKIPRPEVITAGKSTVHSWSEADVERIRKLLPKIANGRKTRYRKQKAKTRTPRATATSTAALPKKRKKK